MISTSGLKRKSSSSLDNSNVITTPNHNSISTLTKRFRGITYDGKNNQNEHRMSLLSSKIKSEQESKKMMIINGTQNNTYKRLDESEMTPHMLTEYRRLQHELQCQEALLVLMQKLKTNQRLISQTNNNNNNNGIKPRTTTSTTTPATATKLNQQLSSITDGKIPLTATKQQSINSNRSTPTKPPHPNQYTVNRSNNNSQISQQQSSKNSLSTPQATRQSNNNNNNHSTNNTALPAAATRISSTVPTSATKNSSVPSTTSTSSKSNGVAAEQHLLNAKLALRKQLEQTLLQIPTPKPSICDLTFIPGVNGWSEFLTFLGLEQALNTYSDIVIRRNPYEISMNLPYVCAQCGTDWSVTWHEMSSNSDTNSDEKILCDRCTKTSQKKLLKQDHSNRLRQAFIKALQQEKELDAKFQHQSSPSTATTPTPTTTTTNNTVTPTTVKQSSSSQQHSSKHTHQTNKHSNKPLSTKTSSHHHHHHNNNNNSSTHNNNHHSHSHHHHHHHHSGKSNSSSSSKSHNANLSTIPTLNPTPAETLASTLAALQTNEQMEFFQKHFLSNMLPYAVANQAAALAAKSSQQQQQQAALAALPAMAASLMRQPNPAQYLLDMIPQAAKQQHHHHHSK